MNRYSEGGPVKSLRVGTLLLDGGFFTNGTTAGDIAAASIFGQLKGLMTITYGATGLYTVVLSAGLSFPSTPIIIPTVVCVSQAASYNIVQVGAWVNTTRTFTLGMLDFAGAAVAPAAANAGSIVQFMISVIDTSAR